MPVSVRIYEFDTWRPGYGLATVTVLRAGTTVPAQLYLDEGLTNAAANPQTLQEKTDGGISYGKFLVPLYIGEPYQLQINSVDETGVIDPPLNTLDGQDASRATVIPSGASQTAALDDLFARSIDVRDYGVFIAVGQAGASASTNNATIIAAIAVASAQGGSLVRVPAGTYQFTDFTLPLGVVLVGAGRETTILQSTIASEVVTISGVRAGFMRLTLDGISQVTNSIGVFAEVIDQIVMNEVEIKRFATGFQQKGGQYSHWKDLYVSDCLIGYQGHGDSDSGKGGPLQYNRWDGGRVELCATVGIELENIDELCQHNVFAGLDIADNTGIGVHVIGARATKFEDCNWNANTTDLTVEDGSPLNANQDNTVVGLDINGGAFAGTSSSSLGAINLKGRLEAVAFRRVEFSNETITITTPSHNVLAQDCRQITGVSFAGTSQAWIASKTYDHGESAGVTTGNSATKAWGIVLQPGQRVYLEAVVIARARNNTYQGMWHFSCFAYQPGATLNADARTASFTAGNIITGQTSKATARITADAVTGSTDVLTLQDVQGTFLNDEVITDTGGGSALVNGSLSTSNSALIGSVTNLGLSPGSAGDGNWAATFVANGPEIDVNVTGDTSQNIEWTVDVRVVSS
jgi:hypothetical protein